MMNGLYAWPLACFSWRPSECGRGAPKGGGGVESNKGGGTRAHVLFLDVLHVCGSG